MRRIIFPIVAAIAAVVLSLVSAGCNAVHGVDAGLNPDGTIHLQADVDLSKLLPDFD